MSHRAKHLRRNWTPERLAKAEERRKREEQRQLDDAAKKASKR